MLESQGPRPWFGHSGRSIKRFGKPAESVKSARLKGGHAGIAVLLRRQDFGRISANALSGAVHGLLVRRRNRGVPGRRRRRCGTDMALLQGFARLLAAA